MSMPGASMAPDDGPYTECIVCGAQFLSTVAYDGKPELRCDECERDRRMDIGDDE